MCLIFKAIKAFFSIFILLKNTFILHVILHYTTIDTYDSSLKLKYITEEYLTNYCTGRQIEILY